MSSLGWYWLVIPASVAVLGIVFVLAGFGHLFAGRIGHGSRRLLFGFPVLAVGTAFGLIALNTQSFARLTHESDVALVRVKTTDAATGDYAVTVKRIDGSPLVITCPLQGDEWLISARVQKWKPWANILGLDSTYALDQIENKYRTATRGNGKTITACDLSGPVPSANRMVPNAVLAWLIAHSYAQQRSFGSASYMPLADGAVYKVVMTQAGLNAEPVNDAARKANETSPSP
ncbi:MAG TPA: hypothetical protein VGG10_16535 [Rhizomicrobium sp.]|jgi:hypothetical protein